MRACDSGRIVIELAILVLSNAKRDVIVLDFYVFFLTKVQKKCILLFENYTPWHLNARTKRTFEKTSLFQAQMLICSMHASQIERTHDTTFSYILNTLIPNKLLQYYMSQEPAVPPW